MSGCWTFFVVILACLAPSASVEVRHVQENVLPGELVYQNTGIRGTSYQFLEQNDFFILTSDGDIITNGSLDREAVVDKYGSDRNMFTVNYATTGTPRQSFTIVIVVDDINDNTPQFNNMPPSISVGSNVQGPVWTLSATDPDRGENGTVSYRIVDGNSEGYFSVNHPEGDTSRNRLYLNSFPPTGRTFSLLLEAFDGGSDVRLSNETRFQVNISDTANDAPVFAQSSYDFRVPFSAATGRVVGQVSAMDPDSNVNSSIVYYLDDQHPSHAGISTYFDVSPSTGVIRLLVEPGMTLLSFLVNARNSLAVSPTPLVATVAVYVHFYHGNDIPQLLHINESPLPPVLHLVEGRPFFLFPVLRVEDSNNITNSSATLSPAVAHRFDYVDFNNRLYIIQLNITQPIDREAIPVVNVTISATDVEGATGSVTVAIRIDDVNDNHPMFEHPEEVSASVPETSPPGWLVVRLNASDPDRGLNGTVRYAVVSAAPEQAGQWFALNGSTGELTVSSPLNYEREDRTPVVLVVSASDLGPDTGAAMATVTVEIQDVDEPPTFAADAPTELEILFSAVPPFTLHSFAAEDDQDDRLQYGLNCSLGADAFMRVGAAGQLQVLSVPGDIPASFQCTISSSDRAGHVARLLLHLFYVGDSCGLAPCANNATCSNSRLGFLCSCPELFGGPTCALPRDPCALASCLNGGMCSGQPLSTLYQCSCREGFAGRHCEVGPASFGKRGFAAYHVSREDLTSLYLEVLTGDAFGLLFLQRFEEGQVSLELAAGRAVFRDTRPGSEAVRVSQEALVSNRTWYSILVQRSQATPPAPAQVSVVVRRTQSLKQSSVLAMEGSEVEVVLGGVVGLATPPPAAAQSYDYSGCMGHVRLNGRLLNLSSPAHSAAWSPTCARATLAPPSHAPCVRCGGGDDLCSFVASRVPAICRQESLLKSFTGNSFAQFTFTDDFLFFARILHESFELSAAATTGVSEASEYEVSLEFATPVADTVLFALASNYTNHFLKIAGTELQYIVCCGEEGQSQTIRLEGNFHDNRWHKATVRIQAPGNTVQLSSEEASVTSYLQVHYQLLLSATTKMYVGGGPQAPPTGPEASPTNPLIGCVANVTVNNLLLPLDTPIEGIAGVYSPAGTFGADLSSCPSVHTSSLSDPAPTPDLTLYLSVAVPAAAAVLLVFAGTVVLMVCLGCRGRRHKGSFTVDCRPSGLSGSTTVDYHGEAGEFHPDEDKPPAAHHLRQTSIDSPTIRGLRPHIPASVSQETGFHEPPNALGSSCTDDLKSEDDSEDADESTQPRSEEEGAGPRGRGQRRSRGRSRRPQQRSRHDSLTSTEERIMNPIRMGESEVRSPSADGGLEAGPDVRLAPPPRPEGPLPVTPVAFQELRSLSVPRVTPNHYWEEAGRMRPAVDTEEPALRLSQLITEQLWQMDPPSSSTSVVSSALDDHAPWPRPPPELHMQGGVEGEALFDTLSHPSEDSLHRYSRGYRHHQPYPPTSHRPPWSLSAHTHHPSPLPGQPGRTKGSDRSKPRPQPLPPLHHRADMTGLSSPRATSTPHATKSPRASSSPRSPMHNSAVHSPALVKDRDSPRVGKRASPGARHLGRESPLSPGGMVGYSPSHLPGGIHDDHAPLSPAYPHVLDSISFSSVTTDGSHGNHMSGRRSREPLFSGRLSSSTARGTPSGLSTGGGASGHAPWESPDHRSPTQPEDPNGSAHHHGDQVYPSPVSYENQFTKAFSPKVTLASLSSPSRSASYAYDDSHVSAGGGAYGNQHFRQHSHDGRLGNYCNGARVAKRPTVDV